MGPMYDRVASEINRICDSCCWHTPRPDCPYFDICTDERYSRISDCTDRTEAFELALVNRYRELHGMGEKRKEGANT